MTVSNFSDVIMLASVHSQYVLASGKCVQYRSLQANALLGNILLGPTRCLPLEVAVVEENF